jgi:branched-chain amino acid transport system substrate-binding protein
LKKVAILSCLSDWSVGLKKSFKDQFTKLGGEIVAEEEFQQESTDLRTQLTKIKDKKPDLIYFPAYTKSTIIGLKQIKELGIKSIIFGADAWSDPQIWKEVGKAGEGAIFTEPANKNLPEWFITAMNQKTGSNEINIYAPRAYDALTILAEAMKTSNFNVETTKNNLYQIKNFQGIADVYTFDANGDPVSAIYAVKKIVNQKPVLME